LSNIYYDLNKAEIRSDAALELDKLVIVMYDNPEINIELSSHTDARAGHDFNMDLSQRRANSAVSYLISNGVAPERVRAKGYGETKLIIKDADTEARHQVNRRTEFKVTKYTKKFQQEFSEGTEEVDETDRFFTDDGDGKD